MRYGLPERSGISRGYGQVEPGVPDRGVFGPPACAAVEPGSSLIESAGRDCLIGPRKPDPVIVAIGHVE